MGSMKFSLTLAIATSCFVSAPALAQARSGPVDGDVSSGTPIPFELYRPLSFGSGRSVPETPAQSAAARELTRIVARSEFASSFDTSLDTSLDFSSDVSLGMLPQEEKDPDAKPAVPVGTRGIDVGGQVAGHASLAEAATNPVAPLIQFQLQNEFIPRTRNASGYSNVFTIQPVIPFKLGDQQVISRFTLPIISQANPDGPLEGTDGLGDLVAIGFLNFPIKKGPWAGTFAVGGGLTFPTATDRRLGSNTWQAGPGLVYINTATPGLQWGAFGYQQWSYAGSGDGVSKLFFQPILNWHFTPGWYMGLGDILWSIDWNDHQTWSIPLAFRLGHITSMGNQKLNIFIEPFYQLSQNAGGADWGFKINVTLLFPEK